MIGGTAWRSGLNAEFYFSGKTGTAQIIGIDQEEEWDSQTVLGPPHLLRDS